MKKYRIGVIGFAHMHILDNMQPFGPKPQVEWVGVSDLEPLRPGICHKPSTRGYNKQQAMKTYGIEKDYPDYLNLLDEKPDLVMIACDNVFHRQVACDALSRGISILLEKPMAMSYNEALEIGRAAENGKAEVIVNWPATWHPAFRLAKEKVDEGAVGKVFKLTYRNRDSMGPFSYGQGLTDAEKGAEWWHQAEAGGGAYWDYCCYGACMASWFFGRSPETAYGLRANFNAPFGNAEDYGAIMAQYPEAVAIIEGSWSTQSSGIPSGPIVYGTEGTLVSGWGNTVSIYKDRHSDKPTEVLEAPALPEGHEDLAAEILNHVEKGAELHPTLSWKVNLDAMAILDAGYRSSLSGKTEAVGNAVWTVGRV